MKYYSEKTEKGNVGVSYCSQEQADRQARHMDNNGCENSINCPNCFNCKNCRNCYKCRYCVDCVGCISCAECSSCNFCHTVDNGHGRYQHYEDLETSNATKEEQIATLDALRSLLIENNMEDRLYMGHWHDSSGWKYRSFTEEVTACNTTHCMAGWMQIQTNKPELRVAKAEWAGFMLAPVAAHLFYRDELTVLQWLKDREYVAELQ